ncbi:hypothetical protein [Halorientalis marina]|nr:hypothetical protein [Halorientalis marina]
MSIISYQCVDREESFQHTKITDCGGTEPTTDRRQSVAWDP